MYTLRNIRVSLVFTTVLAAMAAAGASERSPHPAALSHDATIMAQAFPEGGLKPADAASAQVAEARKLAAKSLGDDVRDLVFVPITPCTVWDTRFATEPQSAGLIANGQTKKFFSHLDGAGGSFAAWGGNPSCPEASEAFIGGRPFAALMTVYVSDASANGWLTLYRDGDPDPSMATISVYYSPGPTRTQTVIAKSSRGYGPGAFDVAATSRFSAVNASASVTGYFIKPVNIVLPTSTASTGNILKGANRFVHNHGLQNTFVGELAGNFTLTANNTAIGYHTLGFLTTGHDNTANGVFALYSNTTGYSNTATGVSALDYNTSGVGNTASGFEALYKNGAHYNTATGYRSLYSNTGGEDNTALGMDSLYSNTGGSANTALGVMALRNNTSGYYNIALGYQAGYNLTNGHHNIAIAHPAVAGEANTVRIGKLPNQTRVFMAGIRDVTTGAADAVNVMIDSSGQLGTVSSSARMKDDIADMGDTTAGLMELRPVTFHYKQHGPGSRLQYGLVAEEVERIYPGLVAKRADGGAETVMYHFLPPMLLNEYQKQQRTIEAQARRIEELEADRRAQVARIEALEKGLERLAR